VTEVAAATYSGRVLRMLANGLALALAALAGGAGAGSPPVHVVPLDPRAAASVPVSGANRLEQQAIRAALARLGRDGPVAKVALDDAGPRDRTHRGRRRELVVTLRARRGRLPARVRSFEAEWLGNLFVLDVVTALHRRGERLDWAVLRGPEGGGTLTRTISPAKRGTTALRALGTRIAERGAAAGLDVQEVTAFRIATGALRVVIRLSTEEILGGSNTTWLSDLVPDRAKARPPYSAELVVLGPGDAPLAYGWNAYTFAGGWAYGASSFGTGPVRSPPLPAGPTRLEIAIDRPLAEPHRVSLVLDCEGASTGVTDPQTACAELNVNWLAFLPPVAGDTTCAGGLTDQMSLSGTIGGVPVEREYSNCYSSTTGRWEHLLGVPNRR
jgi:hypothetical protein